MTLLLLAVLGAAPSCVEVRGDRILAGDLAARIPQLAPLDPSAVFGLAPRPGLERNLTAEEMQSFARRLGIEAEVDRDVCVVGLRRKISHQEVEAALAGPLMALTGRPEPIEILAISQREAPEGRLVFPPQSWTRDAGGNQLRWRGFIAAASGARYPVWATIRTNPESQPRRQVQSHRPREVRAGERVSVEVRAGAAHLSIEAIAETSGRPGESVTLRNVESGRKFRAIVAGPGMARIGDKNAFKN